MATRFGLNFEAVLSTTLTPLAGGTLTFYATGTSSLRTIWSNKGLSTTKLNPVTLDASGEHGDIWLDDPSLYRLVVKDALGSVIPGGDIDPIDSVSSAAGYAFSTTAALLSAFGSTDLLPTGTQISTLGRTTTSDTGGARFYYDASDTTSADNGGTIRVDTQNRRWKIAVSGSFNVRWFGATGDGTTDDITAINACVNAAYNSAASYHSVFFPVGVYVVSTCPTLKASFLGEDPNNTIIKAKSTFSGTTFLLNMNVASGANRIISGITFDLRALSTGTSVSSIGSSSAGTTAGSFRNTWLNCTFIGLSTSKALIYVAATTTEVNWPIGNTFIGCTFSSPRCFSLGAGANCVEFISCAFDNGVGGSTVPFEVVGSVNVKFSSCNFELLNCGGAWWHIGYGTTIIDNCYFEGLANITDTVMFQIDATGTVSTPECRLIVRGMTFNLNYTGASADKGIFYIQTGTGAAAFKSCYVYVQGIHKSATSGTPWGNIFSTKSLDANAKGPIRLTVIDCDEISDVSIAHTGTTSTTANVVWQLQGWYGGKLLNHTAPEPAAGSRHTWTWVVGADFTG